CQLVHVGSGAQEFACGAIEDVEKSVAIRVQQQLAHAAVKGHVDQHGPALRVPVMRVVRCELEMPFELSGLEIERDNRAGVKIVAAPSASVEIRPGISGGPVEQVQIRIEGSAEPGSPATPLNRKIAPGLRARIALGGNGIKAPELLAGRSRV